MIAVEEDGDEIFLPPTYCSKCRVGFDHKGKALYAFLFAIDGFYKCTVCGGSYGPVEPTPSRLRKDNGS